MDTVQPSLYGQREAFVKTLTFLIFLVCVIVAGDSQGEPEPDKYAPNEVIVSFDASASAEDKTRMQSSIGLTEIRAFEHLNVIHYTFPAGNDIEVIIQRINTYPFVKFAEPNYFREQQAVDPGVIEQWFLNNGGQVVNGRDGPVDIDIDWSEARSVFTPNQRVVVAVIDTGVALDHPELFSNRWINENEISDNRIDDDGNGYVDDRVGWDFVDYDPLPLDENGHGTLVASTIAALDGNGILGTGVAPEAKIMALRTLNDFGQGRSFVTTVDLFIESTTYAANNGARIINASFGSSAYSSSEMLQIDWLKSKGVLLVAAAGNGGVDGLGDNNDNSPIYPASYDASNIISVAAIDRSGTLAEFSNFGSSSVDIAAPGTDIFGADISRSSVYLETFEGGAAGWLQGHLAGSQSTLAWSLFRDPYVFNTWITDSIDSFGNVTNYRPNTNSYVESPWITVPLVGAQFEYRIYHELEDFFYDELLVETSLDGVNWYIFGYHTGFSYDIHTLGSVERVDIPSVLGGSQIKVRFRLLSDANLEHDGAYIDYVQISQTDVFAWNGEQFQHNNGTSFSAPVVSGVAALLLSHAPSLTYSQVKNLILSNSDKSAALNGKVASGGRVNAHRALLAADELLDTAPPGNAINGTSGDDRLSSQRGNDVIDGLGGNDTINFSGNRSQYNVTKLTDGYQIEDKISGRDGTDVVSNAEFLKFADMSVDLTMASKAASISASDLKTLEELYVGFFNRVPEAAGLSGWINQIKSGVTLKSVADQFYDFGVLFGVYDKNMSDSDFIAEVYANVLGRTGATAPTNDEIAGWQNWLHTGTNTKGAMVLEMLRVSHGLFTGHPEVGWVIDLLDNKAEVANYFAVQQGLSYNTPQENIDHGTAIAAAITPSSTAAAIAMIGLGESSL